MPSIRNPVCCKCGHVYTNQDRSFPVSNSPYFAGNGGHLPICLRCLDASLRDYVDLFGGSLKRAVEHLCSRWDIYVNDAMFASGHLETKDLPMRELNRLNNLRQNKNKTYDTRLKELERELGLEWRKSVFMEEYDKTEDAAELKAEPTANMIRLWGRRPDPADYRNLEEKYAKLSQDIDIPNSVVEGLVRELCVISLEQRKCLESGSVQHYEKLVKAFQSTLDFINQRPQSNKPVENTDPLGVLLRDIEKYAPAEYYKDKKIFADSDRISEYIKKVFLRPMRNLLLGTRDEDAEYSVGDDGFA